jgi:hypothetical protein
MTEVKFANLGANLDRAAVFSGDDIVADHHAVLDQGRVPPPTIDR